MLVSIIVLVHNAPIYTKHTLETLKKTTDIDYEVIAFDNGSNPKTVKMLKKMDENGYIDKLVLSEENLWFAKGNNEAAKHCSEESKYVLLLNSDVEIRDSKWLKILVDNYESGAISYGISCGQGIVRADGYCLLLEKKVFLENKLDEQFQFWFSVTKFQADLLNAGYKVKAVVDHKTLLYHYGGMSGIVTSKVKGMTTEDTMVQEWFGEHKVELIDKITGNNKCYSPLNWVTIYSYFVRFRNKVRKKLMR